MNWLVWGASEDQGSPRVPSAQWFPLIQWTSPEGSPPNRENFNILIKPKLCFKQDNGNISWYLCTGLGLTLLPCLRTCGPRRRSRNLFQWQTLQRALLLTLHHCLSHRSTNSGHTECLLCGQKQGHSHRQGPNLGHQSHDLKRQKRTCYGFWVFIF